MQFKGAGGTGKKRFDFQSVPNKPTAILASGGLKSSVLLAHLLEEVPAVYPIYVRQGLPAEPVEEKYLRRFLAAVRGPSLGRLTVLDLTCRDTNANMSDLLVQKVHGWLKENEIQTVLSGHRTETMQAENPSPVRLNIFDNYIPDLTRPMKGMSYADIVRHGVGLPLEFTFSCETPLVTAGLKAAHCGECRNCRQRMEAFAEVQRSDRTVYHRTHRSMAESKK